MFRHHSSTPQLPADIRPLSTELLLPPSTRPLVRSFVVLCASWQAAMARVKCAKPECLSKAQRQVYDSVSGRRAYPKNEAPVRRRRRRAGKLAEKEVKKYKDSVDLLLP